MKGFAIKASQQSAHSRAGGRSASVRGVLAGLAVAMLSACAPSVEVKLPSREMPPTFDGSEETASSADINWRNFFRDPNLIALIETALGNNQELNIFLQELEIAKNEVSARSGEYLPFVELGTDAGLDKVGRYTRFGSLEENNEIAPGKEFPEPLPSYAVKVRASWEVDIWRRLRNAKDSALERFLASREGRNFLVTNLISEVANSYYELCALDSQLDIVKQNIKIQGDALATVKQQKEGARVTELAVRRFDAQLAKTSSLQYDLQQQIFETENKINFLLGRFPQQVKRSPQALVHVVPRELRAGVPSQLLRNRADIRRAELELSAAALDIEVARAAFYPSLNITGEVGYEAYRIGKLFTTPESLLYGLTGGIAGPLFNRRALTADFYNANAMQVQAVFRYERAVLNAFVESANQISNLKNLEKSVAFKAKQVDALTSSVDIAGTLFTSARADYGEVLLTQREAIEGKFELVETKMRQMQAQVNLYRALGGGWTRERES